MIREEAIKWMKAEKASLERAPDLNGCPMTAVWQEAIDVYDMAISALRNQEPVTNRHELTNADRIRAMSDEELVKMLWKTGRNYRAVCSDPVVDFNEYHDDLMDWLQQPAEEDDHA